ncbi:uncharacterized protein LOC129286115 [Prosopis cineraria]|uniref:uncharacterized protein LOC129286115 n=1 Tax=Prosopis cineraria TaxID=364024 RepID=UPI00240FBFDB|nr:uncharacterized protein LOC129286115 [Prosopis cineraria]
MLLPENIGKLIVMRIQTLVSAIWSPPTVGEVEVNCDGSFLRSFGFAGIGIIWRDHNSSFIKGYQDLHHALSSQKWDNCSWMYHELLANSLRSIGSFHHLNLPLVRRSGNNAADFLVASASKGVEPSGWVFAPSPPAIITNDLIVHHYTSLQASSVFD